ncbi:MAG: OmpA family protein [Desulfobacterales bacterium]|nr:OmpA family protein [Desulfobacterales bacterium]
MTQVAAVSGGTRDTLFHATEALVTKAKEKRANLYAPETFGDAMEAYQDALEDFEDQKDLKGIKEDLAEARELLNSAMEVCRSAEVLFEVVMKARDDARSIEALKYSLETMVEAEETFQRAIRKHEDGDLDDARNYAAEAELLFRKGELITIKKSLLGRTRKKVFQYQDMGRRNKAPKTLAKAVTLLTRAEKALEKSRYGNAKAAQLVKEADYEMAHTESVHKRVLKLEEAEFTFEDVIIDMEKQLLKIGDSLGAELKFDSGVSGAVWQLLDLIQGVKAQSDAKEREIAALNTKIKTLEASVGRLSKLEQDLLARKVAAEEALKRQKEAERLRQLKLKRIRETFARGEGKVLMDGDNMIIRLNGLSFPSGKSEIGYQYFGLLAKVRDTFKEFPKCSVVIEGHTDSLGSDKVNKQLSKSRADAVRHYLIANSSVTQERISAVGYGEAKPVASNESAEGRANNRRIDVVIIPDRG